MPANRIWFWQLFGSQGILLMTRQFVCCLTLTLLNASLVSANLAAADPVKVEMVTSEGTIVLELNADQAPKTVDNFLKYVRSDHYPGTIFHRVIDGFMIQGGGMGSDLREKKTLPPVRNEAGNELRNEKYTIAMARTGEPHSATSQFFINTADNSPLNRAEAKDGYGYTVFGKVIQGQEVVDKIEKTPTRVTPNPAIPGALMSDVPVNPISINSIQVIQ